MEAELGRAYDTYNTEDHLLKSKRLLNHRKSLLILNPVEAKPFGAGLSANP